MSPGGKRKQLKRRPPDTETCRPGTGESFVKVSSPAVRRPVLSEGRGRPGGFEHESLSHGEPPAQAPEFFSVHSFEESINNQKQRNAPGRISSPRKALRVTPTADTRCDSKTREQPPGEIGLIPSQSCLGSMSTWAAEIPTKCVRIFLKGISERHPTPATVTGLVLMENRAPTSSQQGLPVCLPRWPGDAAGGASRQQADRLRAPER